MKFIFIICLAIFPFLLFAKETCLHDEHNFRCVKYIRNYDADTVTFNIPHIHPLIGRNMSVRLLGIDAPEIKTSNACEKEKAKKAKNLVGGLLKNAKRIDLEKVKKGKYFRIVADIKFDGKYLKDYLLRSGLAYPYQGGKKKKVNWCKTVRGTASEK